MIKQQQKKKTIIPEYKNYQEEAAWFDSHDLSDYCHELNPVDIDFQLEKPKEENIVVRVQKPIKDRIEKIARRKGLTISSLTRMWIIEKLHSIYR